MLRVGIILALGLSYYIACTHSVSAYEIPSNKVPEIPGADTVFLEKLSQGLSAVAKYAKQGVVFVSIEKVVKGMGGMNGMDHPFFDFFFGPNSPFGEGDPRQRQPREAPERRQKGQGSGFIVDLEKGYVFTNNHVIEEADDINLKLANGKEYSAKVVGRDKTTDVAVVEIQDKDYDRNGLVQLNLGDSEKVDIGNMCLALGSPFGLEASASFGVISAIGRGSLSITELGDFVQTDSAINPGNSGGPLIGVDGTVIGMNTAIYSRSGGYAGIGFAIPSNMVRLIATQLINDGKISRGYLGVLLQDLPPELRKNASIPDEYSGVAFVQTVQPGSPADQAGLQDGDVIVSIDGQKIVDMQDLRNKIGLKPPGSEINLKGFRDGKEMDFNVTLGDFAKDSGEGEESPEDSAGEDSVLKNLGLSVVDLSPSVRQRYNIPERDKSGVVVVDAFNGSPAFMAGVREGDLIVAVGRTIVPTVAKLKAELKGKKSFFLKFKRDGKSFSVPIQMR